jgi:hypothetical protein
MKFPLQAVRHLLLCTAFPIGGGGGGKNISSSSPVKKRQRGPTTHPDPPTSKHPTSKPDEVDIDKELTPKMDGASLGGDDERDCGVVLGQQQQPSPGDGDDYFEGVVGEENNIICSMPDKVIVDSLYEYSLEASFENGEDDSKPAARGETREKVIPNTNSTYQLRGGAFAKHYDGLLNTDEASSPEFKAFIIKLVKWVDSIGLHAFGTAKEMETKFNQKRDDILIEMKAALKKNGREDLEETINLASKFSVSTLIVFFLHYAPDGCNPVDDDDSNYCHLDQVRTLLCCSLFYYYYNTQITHNIIIFIVLYLNDGKETTQLLH